MSKKGCCWDNAVAGRFFGSLKQERFHWRNYETRYAEQQDVLNYITMCTTANDFIHIWIIKVLTFFNQWVENYKWLLN